MWLGLLIGFVAGFMLAMWRAGGSPTPRPDNHRTQVKINSYASRIRKLADSLEQAVKPFNQGE